VSEWYVRMLLCVTDTDVKCQMSMSKTFIGGAVMSRVQIGGAGGRRNVRLSRMQQRTVLFSDVP